MKNVCVPAGGVDDGLSVQRWQYLAEASLSVTHFPCSHAATTATLLTETFGMLVENRGFALKVT